MNKRKRRAYYIDAETAEILQQMALLTDKSQSALICDAVKQTYSRTSKLSKERIQEIQRLAEHLFPLIFGQNFYK